MQPRIATGTWITLTGGYLLYTQTQPPLHRLAVPEQEGSILGLLPQELLTLFLSDPFMVAPRPGHSHGLCLSLSLSLSLSLYKPS